MSLSQSDEDDVQCIEYDDDDTIPPPPPPLTEEQEPQIIISNPPTNVLIILILICAYVIDCPREKPPIPMLQMFLLVV